ncbi:MAG: Hsp20/alpha crystallin family protein [Anaerolineae bacterium]
MNAYDQLAVSSWRLTSICGAVAETTDSLAIVLLSPLRCAQGCCLFLEVDIIVEGDILTIRGELRPPLENVDYLFQERLCGAFSRTLTLNVPVDAGKAEAVFENGVLMLTLPKAEETKPRVIRVKSK